jgi:hypothetical protein
MKAFRDARRSAFCKGILAFSAAIASNSAIAEFGRKTLFAAFSMLCAGLRRNGGFDADLRDR